jgi:DNA-directed RNA polymerase subunit RPC12/RpoP
MTLFAQSPRASTVRPACTKCGAPMWLTRIQPDKPGFARRTLECPRCQRRIIEVIELEKAAS